MLALCLGFGFFVGQRAQAVPGLIPGSEKDPLVSRSYLEEASAARVQDLQRELQELKTKLKELQQRAD